MALMRVFDRPTCCATGACGPNVEPRLTQFAADLEWLMSHGVEVRRFSFDQEPHAFAECELVRIAVAKSGDKCLPLILLDGEVVAEGAYPSREELAVLTSVTISQGASAYSHAVEELVAIGAAIGANSAAHLEDHFRAGQSSRGQSGRSRPRHRDGPQGQRGGCE